METAQTWEELRAADLPLRLYPDLGTTQTRVLARELARVMHAEGLAVFDEFSARAKLYPHLRPALADAIMQIAGLRGVTA